MSLPPKESDILKKYYQAGLNEIAFNIEIFDRSIAAKLMPEKGLIPLEDYKNTLLQAVEIFGKDGNVKCLLVYGLESDKSFLKGIDWLASHGIQPIISVFRPLRNTDMEHIIPPNSRDLLDIYYQALQICQKHHMIPGPDCIYCQNNTLSLPIDIFYGFHN